MSDSSAAPARPGTDRRLPAGPPEPLVRVGLAVFAAGVVVIAVAVIGFAFGAHNWPLWVNVCCGAFAPAGMLLAVVGALRAGRRDQREALRAVQQR
jgi:hypothetical protein